MQRSPPSSCSVRCACCSPDTPSSSPISAASTEACTTGIEAKRAGAFADSGPCLVVGRARKISRLQPDSPDSVADSASPPCTLARTRPFTAANREAGDENALEKPPIALDKEGKRYFPDFYLPDQPERWGKEHGPTVAHKGVWLEHFATDANGKLPERWDGDEVGSTAEYRRSRRWKETLHRTPGTRFAWTEFGDIQRCSREGTSFPDLLLERIAAQGRSGFKPPSRKRPANGVIDVVRGRPLGVSLGSMRRGRDGSAAGLRPRRAIAPWAAR